VSRFRRQTQEVSCRQTALYRLLDKRRRKIHLDGLSANSCSRLVVASNFIHCIQYMLHDSSSSLVAPLHVDIRLYWPDVCQLSTPHRAFGITSSLQNHRSFALSARSSNRSSPQRSFASRLATLVRLSRKFVIFPTRKKTATQLKTPTYSRMNRHRVE